MPQKTYCDDPGSCTVANLLLDVNCPVQRFPTPRRFLNRLNYLSNQPNRTGRVKQYPIRNLPSHSPVNILRRLVGEEYDIVWKIVRL